MPFQGNPSQLARIRDSRRLADALDDETPARDVTASEWTPAGKQTALREATGRWYVPAATDAGTATLTEDRLWCGLLVVGRSDLILDALAIEVTTTTKTGTGVIRLGAYAYSDGLPGALIVDAGTIDAETSGVKEITGIDVALSSGGLFLALCPQEGDGPGVNVGTALHGLGEDNSAEAFGVPSAAFQDSVTGALPDPFSATGVASGNRPYVAARFTT